MEQIILFIFLSIFPFGQIIRMGIIQPIDVIVGLGAVYAVWKGYKSPPVFKYLKAFLGLALFSWLFSLVIFRDWRVLYSALYLVRLGAYFYFLVYTWNFAQKSGNKKLLVSSLLAVSLVSAVFGWIQYKALPSLHYLQYVGWDEHLYRIVGTFFDPTFLGLIIVFGLLIALSQYFATRRLIYAFISVFLTLTLAFTYSRGSYLAFFAGALFIFHYYKKLRYFLAIVLGFVVLMFALPTSQNNILSFTREFSALARIQNYGDAINIFKTSPLFGVGYGNYCIASEKVLGIADFESHSCFGSDSSLLLVLATTGVVGFLVFLSMIGKIIKSLPKSPERIVFHALGIAVLVHSLFSNSMFYPWIMGYLIILLGVCLGRESES